MAFKRIATLDIKQVYATDANGVFQWKEFVKQANENPSQDRSKFLPKEAYKYDTDNFLFLTARAISGGEKWGHNGNYDYFPWEEIKKALPTYPGCGFYIEHKEDSVEDAKGIILDAFADDEQEYVTCLCAIDKKAFPEFCQQLLDGTYNQVSMSCLANECECLTPGTHILTPEGQTKIQDIKVGDYVLTHKGRFRKVLETFKNPMPEYTYKIYFESGRENQVINDYKRYNGTWIRATGNHPIYMADGTWKNAENIQTGDIVKCLTKKCPVCGKDIVYSKTQKYCSASCQSKDIQNKENIKNKKINSYKETCNKRTFEDKQKLHDILSEGQKKFQKSECYAKRKLEMTDKANRTIKQHFKDGTLDKEKQRRSDYLKNRWKNDSEFREKNKIIAQETFKKMASKKRSFLEEKFEGFLIREGLRKDIDYKTNDFLYINKLRAYPDFKFEKQKLIVEIDGDYWHNNPKAIERDTYKNKIWEENGWTVIRYTGKQVNNEFEKVKDSFRRIFKNHNHEYTFGDFKVIKVEKIKTTPKCHHVYNLHVEEDESYIAENLVVHNCSECHNVAHSFDELCQHMNPNMPITYMKGKVNSKGEDIYEINRDLCFTGLSSVAVPADKDAFVFDIKAAKKKENKLQVELVKYQNIKQAGKMKEFKMACEEQFKNMDNFTLLNKLKNSADNIINTISTQENDVNIITSPLQGILRQLMELQIGLNVMDLNKLQEPKEDNTVAVEDEPNTDVAEVTTNVDEKADGGHILTNDELEEVNFDKDINSMLKEANLLEKESDARKIARILSDAIRELLSNECDHADCNMSSFYKSLKLITEAQTMISNIADDFNSKRVEDLNKQEEVNLDKEIDSYLDGDNYSYTPFSSTAKVKKQAGTWAIPDTEEKVYKLKDILKEPLPASEAYDKISDLIGDDELYDEIDDYLEVEPNEAVNNVIKYHLKRIKKCPLNHKSYNTKEEYKEAEEAKKLWNIILKDY